MNWAQRVDRREIRIAMCNVEQVIVAEDWAGSRFLM